MFDKENFRYKNKYAYIKGEKKITWDEFLEDVEKNKALLISLGVSKGDRICVHSEPELEYFTLICACLSLHICFIPVDLSDNYLHLSEKINSSKPSYIFGPKLLSENCLSINFDYVDWSNLVCINDNANISGSCLCLEDAAYGIFTSGSTGKPKLVLVSHKSIFNLLNYLESVKPFKKGDKASLWSALTFDASIPEYMCVLSAGCTLQIYPDRLTGGPIDFFTWLKINEINMSFIPPFFMKDLSQFAKNHTLSLKRIMTGVEPVKQGAIWDLLDTNKNLVILNGYGPTETTVCPISYNVTCRIEGDPNDYAPIGKPIVGAGLLILDDEMKEVEDGSIGEIYLSGDCLAIGYFNADKEDNKSFIDENNPYGIRLYRTGDLGFINSNGDLVFHGRKEHLLKIRGKRISRDFIEKKIETIEGVLSCIVGDIKNPFGNLVMFSFVVIDNELTNLDKVRKSIDNNIQESLRPDIIDFGDELPRTINGKKDRNYVCKYFEKKLFTSDIESQNKKLDESKCNTIHDIIASFLPDNFLLEDSTSFASIGLDSITTMRIASKIREEFSVDIIPSSILSSDNIYNLSEMIINLAVNSELDGSEFKSNNIASRSVSQVMIHNLLYEESIAYQAQCRINFMGNLCIDTLESSLRTLIDRHEIIRSKFSHDKNGDYIYEVSNDFYFTLPIISLHGVQSTTEIINKNISKKIHESDDFLIKWILLTDYSQEHVLVQLEHHYAHDGYSSRILLLELAHIYNSKLNNCSIQLDTPTQYSDFCNFEHQFLSSERVVKAQDFWGNYLKGSKFNVDLPGKLSNIKSFKGGQVKLTRSNNFWEDVAIASKRLKFTPFSFLFSVFSSCISEYSDTSNFVIGTAVSNRTAEKFESTVGMLVNLIPIRLDIHDNGRFNVDSLAKSVNSLNLALDHQSLPHLDILGCLDVNDSNIGDSPVNIVFNCHNSFQEKSATFEGIEVDVEEALFNGTSKFELSVTVIPPNNYTGVKDMKIIFEYDKNCYSKRSISDFSEFFLRKLNEAIDC